MKKTEKTAEDSREFGRIARGMSLFERMHIGLMERILARVLVYEYSRGEKVCRQGSPGDSFYIVSAGKLAVSVRRGLLPFSRRVAELGPGSCFGEMALLEKGGRRTATVEALEDCRLFVLLADHFNAAVADNPEFKKEIRDLAAERKFELQDGRN